MITEDDEWSRIEREIKRRAAQEPSMTTLRQAAQQALNAIHLWHWAGETHLLMAAHDALREALEQPEQEPVAWGVFEGNLHDMFFTQEEAQEMAQLKETHAEVRPLYTTPPAAQPEPPPEWEAINNIIAEYGLQAIDFVADWKAAQRPWQGLTDDDWGWVADKKGTSLDTFDQGAAWAQQRLMERNK